MSISEYLAEIKSAIYGREVRGAIYNALQTCYNDATGNPDSIAAYAKQVSDLNGRLDDDEKIFSDLSNNFVTGADYARIGNMAFCRGALTFRDLDVDTASGNVYVGTAEYNDSGKVLETGMELQAAFPVCFTSRVSCIVSNHGLKDHLTISKVVADNGGISEVGFLSGKSHTGANVPVRYIAVGRIDGDRALGARVVTEALSHLNCPEYYDTGKTWAEHFVDEYNKIPAVVAAGNTQAAGAGWCSEFINVCAYDAGIDVGSVDYFPYFAGSQKGMERFHAIGCLYAVTGTASDKTRAFQKVKTINTNTTDAFSVTLDTTAQAYVPQVGDVLFLGTTSNPTVPGHTALVCGVDKDDEEYSIYTVEGNLSLYDTSGNAYEYKTVQRRKRNVWAVDDNGNAKSLGARVLAVGRVIYPIDYVDPTDTFQATGNTGSSSGDGSGVQSDWDETNETSAAFIKNKPSALKNPYALTFTGAVTDTYDGSAAKTINIPTSSSSGASGVGNSVWYGTCNTAGATETKVVSVDSTFSLSTGVMCLVRFDEADTTGSASLNVGGTGAKTIQVTNGAAASRGRWSPNEIVPFVYNGEAWVMVDGGAASTSRYGVTTLSSSTTSTSEVFAATSKAVNDVRTKIPELQAGTVTVTVSSANTKSTATVTFGTTFSGTPRVTATPRSASSDTIYCYVSDVSATGFTVNVMRNSAKEVYIDWIAAMGAS